MCVLCDADAGTQCIFAIGVNGAPEVGDDAVAEIESDFTQRGFDQLQGEFLDIVTDLQAMLIYYLRVIDARYTGE